VLANGHPRQAEGGGKAIDCAAAGPLELRQYLLFG